jgi:uncharacterized HAD superfamily protein
MQRLIAVDLDGTLTKECCWNEDDCLKATPRQDMIDYVNKLYLNGDHIVIWTARRESLRTATEYWLRANKVLYHAIDMHKIGCHIYIDDKAINSIDTNAVINYVENHAKGGEIKMIDILRR